MRLKNERESKNFVDHTNFINRLGPNWGSFRGEQNSLTGALPPAIPQDQLTRREQDFVDRYGLSPSDILLMRTTGATLGQIMRGWRLQPNMGEGD